MTEEDKVFIMVDRLIYQTDNARIYHVANDTQYGIVRDEMDAFPNNKLWKRVHDTFDNDRDDAYLIYHRR